jgi:CubicO group peptidase (beta-lactamase class C family)
VTTDPADFYQYLWWVDTEQPGRFFAAGNYGQFLYVAPDRDAVVVRFGERYDGLSKESWVSLLRSVADRVE